VSARYIVGDIRDVLATIPDGSVDLILTSPPFLALRSYLPADHPDKGREIVLAYLNAGDFFGELSIFDNEPRSAAAYASGDNGAEIYSISKSALVEFNYNNPHIMNVILQNIIIVLSGRMRKLNDQMRDVVFWGFSAKK